MVKVGQMHLFLLFWLNSFECILGCFKNGIDYFGNDVNNGPSVNSAADCQNMCKANSECVVFTLNSNREYCFNMGKYVIVVIFISIDRLLAEEKERTSE